MAVTGPASPSAAPAASASPLSEELAAARRLSTKELAAAVLFGCADSRDTGLQQRMAKAGFGGIVLLGGSTPTDLKQRLRRVMQASPTGRPVMIASDEEGGAVQRLGSVIYPLPSAQSMGGWSTERLTSTADRYGTRMKALGVGMSLGPVADLLVPGSYMAGLHRSFGSNPRAVGNDVIAWADGMRAAGVVPVLKHWPGHGHAVDTHQFAATVPPLKQLRRADMIPFEMAVHDGAPAVMVAHVQARGLTKRGEPATQSPKAIAYLRAHTGADVVVITDSLSMAAATSARGLSESQAVVAALHAGVDWAMTCSTAPLPIQRAVARAIRSGKLSRSQLEQSYARIAALRRQP